MNIKTISTFIFLFVLFPFYNGLSAQVKTDDTIKGRYIIIDELDVFFENSDETISCNITIYNILESESSKPLHIEVNNLQNVVKFSIKSASDIYENQRQSRLVLKKDAYLSTFRTSLIKMNIKYVLFKGDLISVDDFYSRVK